MPRLSGAPLACKRSRSAPRVARGLLGTALLLAASVIGAPGVARAQDAAVSSQAPAPASTSPPPPPAPEPSAPVAPPAPAPPEPAAAPVIEKRVVVPPPSWFAPVEDPAPVEERPTDHEGVVRHVGIGFLGVSELPIARALPAGTKDEPGLSPNDRLLVRAVTAPTLGARFWLSKRFGLDAGIGFSFSSGSVSSDLGGTTVDVDKESIFAFLVHAGVPIVITDLQHMALLVVPAATFGMARSDVEPIFDENAPPAAELRGARLDVGVRAGAEVHFGFMGLPNLALEAGIGLLFTTEWASAAVGDQSIADVSTRISTTSFSDPWDLFSGVGSVSARYYF
jgi:hypothetical protein